MDIYAAKRVAIRKFIEHKGQDFLRQNTQNLIQSTETSGNIFRMIWTLGDVRPEDRLITGEAAEDKRIVISVDLDSGDVLVEKDTIDAKEEDKYKDIIDKSWIAKNEEA